MGVKSRFSSSDNHGKNLNLKNTGLCYLTPNVDVLIKVRAKRSIMEFENERQSASVEINYRIRSKSALRRFKQTLQLSGIAPSMPQTQFTKPKSQFTHAA